MNTTFPLIFPDPNTTPMTFPPTINYSPTLNTGTSSPPSSFPTFPLISNMRINLSASRYRPSSSPSSPSSPFLILLSLLFNFHLLFYSIRFPLPSSPLVLLLPLQSFPFPSFWILLSLLFDFNLFLFIEKGNGHCQKGIHWS